ncbi:MAG TPA: N-acetylmuramoyl-L-alanine amidase, partial [Roseiflexaceae bacterium]|nr:N-acetylmuramoyl-L-alanine amidase [Roseiflexaceae bacterium]
MPKRLMYSALLCLLLVAALPPAAKAQSSDGGRPDQIVLTPPERNQSLRSATGTDYLSPSTEAPHAFTHMLLRWQASVPEGASMQLEVRASADGSTWTHWTAVEENDDLWMPDDGPNTTWSQTIDAGFAARFWQVRGSFTSAPSGALPELKRVDVNTVDVTTFAPRQTTAATPRAQPNGLLAKPDVVSRAAWGCPDGEGSRVRPAYYPVNHMVVHHTADSNTLLDGEPNWAARVRAEWSFHTFTRGWGDVGYNYLIDPNGVIYEGRAGGDDAVAFHDTANYGSMGVVLIGTYNAVQPTAATQNSLVALLSWKASQKRIDPLGRSYYYGCAISTYCYPYNRGAIVLNIAGHRNVMPGQTTCPGDQTIDILPNIRNRVKQALDGTPADNGDLEIDELETSFARSNANWYDATCGAGGHTYYTFGTDNPAESTNSATWRPNVPAADTYRVFAHIPQGCGLGTAPYATQKAVYKIHSADGDFQRTVDQNTADEWVDLGLYHFGAGTDGAVELSDMTGDPFSARKVVFFDSVKWVPESDSTNVALVNVAYDKDTV